MRYSGILAVVGLVAAVTLVAAFQGSAAPGSPRPAPHRAAGSHSALGFHPALRSALQQALQQYLASRPHVARPPLRAVVPPEPGGTCFVGAGSCSETPCVVPVQSGAAVTSAVAQAVAAPVTQAVPAPVPQAVPSPVTRPGVARPGQAQGAPNTAGACPSGPAAPKSLRVVGR